MPDANEELYEDPTDDDPTGHDPAGHDPAGRDAPDDYDPDDYLEDLSGAAILAGIRDVEAADDTAADGAAEVEAQEIYRGILSRNPEHDFDPTIDRVLMLMNLLGDPQDSFRAIHLTGTNGKTSTARMTESLLSEMGLRTGRFTSPHLHTVRERIVIDTEPISAAKFVEVWRDIEPYVDMVDEQLRAKDESRLSFFEVLTGLAYAAFSDAPIDVAVIEVGMGGEWDSTNVVGAEVAVFTPISRDHDAWLGTTIEEIATVKAGIIKELDPAQAVITATQPEAAEAIIAAAARDNGARIVAEGFDASVAERQVAVGGQLISLQTPAALYTEIFLPVHGPHQAHNALLALCAVEAFLGGGSVAGDIVEAGFAAVTSPGRLEVVRSSPTVVVDAAHNPAGAQSLVDGLEDAFGFSRVIAVVGVMADKDAESILSILEPHVDAVVVTQSSSVRSMDTFDLAEIARDVFDPDDVHEAASLPDAIALAADLAEQGQVDEIASGTGVIVAGSVILAADVRALFGRDREQGRDQSARTTRRP